MKRYILLFIFILGFCISFNAKVRYDSSMSSFIGTWRQDKKMDYDGVFHVKISNVDGEIIIKAQSRFPEDLPSTIVSIPISDVQYKDGVFSTFGENRSIPSHPTYELYLSLRSATLHLKLYMSSKDTERVLVNEANLVEIF